MGCHGNCHCIKCREEEEQQAKATYAYERTYQAVNPRLSTFTIEQLEAEIRVRKHNKTADYHNRKAYLGLAVGDKFTVIKPSGVIIALSPFVVTRIDSWGIRAEDKNGVGEYCFGLLEGYEAPDYDTCSGNRIGAKL